MKNRLIVIGSLLALAAAAHDIGVYRANKRAREIVADKDEYLNKVVLRNQALCRYVDRTMDDHANIVAARLLVDDIKFIKVVSPK